MIKKKSIKKQGFFFCYLSVRFQDKTFQTENVELNITYSFICKQQTTLCHRYCHLLLQISSTLYNNIHKLVVTLSNEHYCSVIFIANFS